MKNYKKPIIEIIEASEGIYSASGSSLCDSIYMKGVYQAPDYSNWSEGEARNYKAQYGCHGCPAFTGTACGLTTHYIDADKADSYDVDAGNRKPIWEQKGYQPDDIVTDWNC